MSDSVDLEKTIAALCVATGLTFDVLRRCDPQDVLIAADLLEERGDVGSARWARGDLHQLKQRIQPQIDSPDESICMVIYPPSTTGSLARPIEIVGTEVSVVVFGYRDDRERVAKVPLTYVTYDFVDLSDIGLSEDLRRLFPYHLAVSSEAFPISDDGQCLVVAVSDTQDLDLQDKLEFATGRRVELRRAASSQITRAISIHYRSDQDVELRSIRVTERHRY